MEKLYVNEIDPHGDVSTVGLFYSRAEAENIVTQLRSVPAKAAYRYEVIEAVRHVLAPKDTRPPQATAKE